MSIRLDNQGEHASFHGGSERPRGRDADPPRRSIRLINGFTAKLLAQFGHTWTRCGFYWNTRPRWTRLTDTGAPRFFVAAQEGQTQARCSFSSATELRQTSSLPTGCTALLAAAERGHAEAAKLLLPHMTMTAVNQRETRNMAPQLFTKQLHAAMATLPSSSFSFATVPTSTIKDNAARTALQQARHANAPLCARMLDPHDLLPLLLPWSVERSRGIHDGAVVRTSTNDDGTTTVTCGRG